MPKRVTRRVYTIGVTGVPESSTEYIETITARHRHLHSLLGLASDSGRLFFEPTSVNSVGDVDPASSTAGSMYGLFALKYALIGAALQGLDPALQHVASLDHCFVQPDDSTQPVRVTRVAGLCSSSGVLLLSSGVMVSLSSDPKHHGFVIPLPSTEAKEAADTAAPATEPSARVVDVAGGEGHYVCCDDRGRVYTWGWHNEYGPTWPRFRICP